MALVILMGPSMYREIDCDVLGGGLDELAPKSRQSQVGGNEP